MLDKNVFTFTGQGRTCFSSRMSNLLVRGLSASKSFSTFSSPLCPSLYHHKQMRWLATLCKCSIFHRYLSWRNLQVQKEIKDCFSGRSHFVRPRFNACNVDVVLPIMAEYIMKNSNTVCQLHQYGCARRLTNGE